MEREVDIPAVMEYDEEGRLVEEQKFYDMVCVYCVWLELCWGEQGLCEEGQKFLEGRG